jgi:hypothetical protein
MTAHRIDLLSAFAIGASARTPIYWTIVSIDTKVSGETKSKPLSNLNGSLQLEFHKR